MNLYKDEIKKELEFAENKDHIKKDIIIVVHNQFDYIKNCIDSIYKNTKNFNLFIWNNGSGEETTNYLKNISKDNLKLYESKENLGFIIPNNIMIKDCDSDYIILLNSDTFVLENWDNILIGYLQNNKDVAVTGFQGGILNSSGVGISSGFGYDVDYICGFCMCFSKEIYKEFGLFDEENIKFAYCEDSDFCLRIKEKNRKIYACRANSIHHFGSRTSMEVIEKYNFAPIVENNLQYLQKRWSKYLNDKHFNSLLS